MVDDQVLIGGMLAVIGLFILYRGISRYREQQSLQSYLQTGPTTASTDSEPQQLIAGYLEVNDPAAPAVAPAEVSDSVSQPGLWAWRIQRKESRGSGRGRTRYRWRTVDGELAVGDIAVYADGRSIALSDEVIDSITTEPEQSTLDVSAVDPIPASADSTDPFDNDKLYLDDTTRVQLDEGGFLEDFLPDWLTVSVGQQTSDPNRYEAAVLEDGDHVWIMGTIDRTSEGDVITESQTASFRLFDQDPETVRESLKTNALRYGIIGTVFTLIGIALAIGLLPAN